MSEAIHDVNGWPLMDPAGRWVHNSEETTFALAVTKDASRVSSTGDGDLRTGRWRTEASTQALSLFIDGTEAEKHAREDAWRNLLNQESVTIGRTVNGVRRVVTARIESIAETQRVGEKWKLTALFRIPDVYWRDEAYTTVTLGVGSSDLSALVGATAPMADCRLLIAGAATPLTAFSIEDSNSATGIAWAAGGGTPFGDWLSTFGTAGAGDGQFDGPYNIALDASGNIFVLDSGNNRVQKFTSAGVYSAKFGSAGSGNGQFINPRGVAIDASGNIYVTDQGNNRVQKFTSAGVYSSQFGTAGTGNGQFSSPRGVAIDASGNIYVLDANNNRVQKFTSAGVYSLQFGTFGSGSGQFLSPRNVAVDSSGNVYVADGGTNRVQKFNSAGTYVSQFGSYGTTDGLLLSPNSIAFDATGNIFVVDSGNKRVQKFTSAGVYSAKFGSAGSGNGQFINPTAIALDASGNIFVVDTTSARVQKFDIDLVFSGVPASKWLLVDLLTLRAQIVTTASFDATGDRNSGLSTVAWEGEKFRATPAPSIADLLSRVLPVIYSQTGGGTAQLRVKRAYL